MSCSANLKDYVPKTLFSQKKPSEWEAQIFAEHGKHKGKSADDAKLTYLSIVKKSQFYGTTFYPPCKSVNNGRKVPNKVIIGVNAEGIMLLKPKDKVPPAILLLFFWTPSNYSQAITKLVFVSSFSSSCRSSFLCTRSQKFVVGPPLPQLLHSNSVFSPKLPSTHLRQNRFLSHPSS